jgi:putative transposase
VPLENLEISERIGDYLSFIILADARRRVLHFQVTVTEHPTQEWTMQQIREACPWEQVPRYLLRDRDAIYGRDFAALTHDMGMEEVVTAPRAPWQNPYVERLVGSIRRECLDHVIVCRTFLLNADIFELALSAP